MKNLRRLAAAYGVLTGYSGVDGLNRAQPEALLAVIALLGAPVRSVGDVERALGARVEQMRRRLLDPVVVVWDDRPPSVVLGTSTNSGRVEVTLDLEDGGTREYFLDLDEFPGVPVRSDRVRKRLTLVEHPPLGYHRLSLQVGSVRAESFLVSAPRRAFRRPESRGRWGLFAPLYGALSRESWGAGDFSDLGRLVELTSALRGDFVATLPLLATFVDEPSPYSPVSRFFWNELFVDPRLLPEWREGAARHEPLENEDLIDYRALDAMKRPLLEGMSKDARARRPEPLVKFTREHPGVLDYARFRARKEDGRMRDDAARAPDFGDDRVLYHVYAQMAAEDQLRSVAERAAASGVQLYFDCPLGVHRYGFDTEVHAPLFAHGADVGAPPDAVFPDGQSWGFPPLLPERSREEGYLYLRRSLESAMRHADLLRVDHVMGLHRQFWIPTGFEKKDGVYVRYPSEELYAVFNLESHRHRCELVGENLGIVPQSVNDSLENHDWRGIYVLQFSLTGVGEEPIAPVPRAVVASFNTHDTPTFAGFQHARDLAERVEVGLLDEQRADELRELRDSAIAALDARLAATPEDSRQQLARWLALLLETEADLVAIALEDLWLEEAPQNVPGRVDLPNWRRKLRYCVDALPQDVVSMLEEIVGRSPRSRNTT